MRPSYDNFEDLAFDEIEAMQRRARNRELAQMRVNSRNHYGPDDEDVNELDQDKWADVDDFDDYDEDEWDNFS